jgi:methylmalonyl-CoA/ethylmalonyl-CoA epimerase
VLWALACEFHHLGVACLDLDKEAKPWLALGYASEGPDFDDPIQLVRGRFLIGAGPRLELLVATGDASPAKTTLARGAKIYHHAFLAPRFDESLVKLRGLGCKLTAGPAPAVAFEGRRIAFLLMPNLNLVELIEKSDE